MQPYFEQNLFGRKKQGLKRKLEIARALATDMKLLLLDEPAAGMNPTETAELLECIKMIREQFGITILLIEHDMSLVMNVCERIHVIHFGKTIVFAQMTVTENLYMGAYTQKNK